ncbi:MAG: potassium channel family protein [Curtobacterium sp.]
MRWTQARWVRVTQWPLAAAALAFLAAYAVEILAEPRGGARLACELVVNVTWVMFVVDYVVMLVLAERRLRWFLRHLLDLAAVALPFLRPLRLLRLVQLFRVLQHTTGAAVRGRVTLYVVVTTALLVFVSALAVFDVERHAPGATIVSFGDALWWAVVTITTVGYGDLTPVTDAGRLIATGVMIGGIALLGVVTATLASWIIEQVGQRDEAAQSATRREIRELTAEVRALREELGQRRPDGGSGTPE